MIFDFKSILPEVKSEFPFMNEPTAVMDYVTTKPALTYDKLDFWVERTPEAIAIITARKTDIQADGFRFEGGKQSINKAEHFCKTQFFKDELGKCLWDWLVYGDAYLWKGGLTALERASAKLRKVGIEIDEDFPTMIKHVPTTTVNILHDGKKIIRFRQTVSGQQDIFFSTEDIIHAKMITNRGKVYGFSPTQACLSEMSTIGYLKDYAGNFFKNGGVPDWMFVLPNEMAGSPNHKKLIEMLQKYKHPQRKHGNLVFAGEVEPTQLGNDLDKVNISDNAIYFASVLALAHNMPVSRVASLIGAKVKVSSGGDDLANEGYWSKVSEHQDRWETWLNTQLFEPFFNVIIKFNRAWKTNEIKEQQRNQFAIGNVASLNKELARWDKQVTVEYLKRQLYIKDVDLEKLDEEFEQKQLEKQMAGQKPIGGKQPDKLETSRGAATAGMRDEKRKTAKITGGYGKSIEFKKITHLLDKGLFFEKFLRWVKESQTRDCYFYIKSGKVFASISTPDENFKLEIKESELTPEQLEDLRQFGKQTVGVEGEGRGETLPNKEEAAEEKLNEIEESREKREKEIETSEVELNDKLKKKEKSEERLVEKQESESISQSKIPIQEASKVNLKLDSEKTKTESSISKENIIQDKESQKQKEQSEKQTIGKIKEIQREENRKYRDIVRKPDEVGEAIAKVLKKK